MEIILKDFDYFKYEFERVKNELHERKEITILLDFEKPQNIFNYNIIGLFKEFEKDNIFSTTNETELNKIMKYLLNLGYFLVLDYVTY